MTIPTNWPRSLIGIAPISASRMHFAISLMVAFELEARYAPMHRIFDLHFDTSLPISRKLNCPRGAASLT